MKYSLDELNSSEAGNKATAQAARNFTAKKFGFSEFKRIVRENSPLDWRAALRAAGYNDALFTLLSEGKDEWGRFAEAEASDCAARIIERDGAVSVSVFPN